MTGAFLRIKRAGKWQAIEIEHLTTEERREHFDRWTKEETFRWLDMLCDVVAVTDERLKAVAEAAQIPPLK